jgi:hypothetical protein
MVMSTAGAIGIAGAIGVGWLWFTPAPVPDRLEYLPASVVTPAAQLAQAQPARAPDGGMQFDFSNETVGAEPKSFLSNKSLDVCFAHGVVALPGDQF